MQSGCREQALGLQQQSRHRLHRGAVGKNLARQHGVVDAQVVLEQALEHRAQVGARLEVASVMELGGLEPGPVGDDAAAPERAAFGR